MIINISLTGCFNSKANECGKIIKVSDKLAEITQANLKIQDVNQLLKIADNFDQSAQQILDKNLKNEKLIDYSKKLGRIYKNYGQITRNFITAFQTKDTEKAILYKQEIFKLSQEEKTLVENINSYCQQN
ncbi:hypothetical protein GM3708_2908 [Geminocystis sp. NIES-3708]|nr:hypothetical protein GM3708_2908 [Geminocystis sp. NIES-3708]